ncbi:unnamed protein product, partial [Iphiclides podalirius]
MAERPARRGSSSAAAAPFAGPRGTQPFSGAFRSRRRQLTQIPIKPPPRRACPAHRAGGGARVDAAPARSACARHAQPHAPPPSYELPRSSPHRDHPNAPDTIAYSRHSTRITISTLVD